MSEKLTKNPADGKFQEVLQRVHCRYFPSTRTYEVWQTYIVSKGHYSCNEILPRVEAPFLKLAYENSYIWRSRPDKNPQVDYLVPTIIKWGNPA
jgi:hypothetical protein